MYKIIEDVRIHNFQLSSFKLERLQIILLLSIKNELSIIIFCNFVILLFIMNNSIEKQNKKKLNKFTVIRFTQPQCVARSTLIVI